MTSLVPLNLIKKRFQRMNYDFIACNIYDRKNPEC